MKILALDGSTAALSVALLDTEQPQTAVEHFEIAPQAHARRLLPVAQQLLTDTGLALADIGGFAFGRGPGAFTGLRVTAGLVQGLAAGLDRPVVPVSTLMALAARCFAATAAARVCVVQDARMGEIYTADFERGTTGPVTVTTERVIDPKTLTLPAKDTVLAGNGWDVVSAATGVARLGLDVSQHHPHALDMARLAGPILAAGGGLPAARALPVYVRDDVARKASRA